MDCTVDEREVPDYYEIVKKPMDFGKIKKKLEVLLIKMELSSLAGCLQCFDTVGWASGRVSGL